MSHLLETSLWAYGPGLTALFAAFLFAFADPFHEILLIVAQDTLYAFEGSTDWLRSLIRVLFSLGGIVLMTWAIWHATRYVVISSTRGQRLYNIEGDQISDNELIDKDLSWTPHLISSLPVLGLIVGVLKTATSGEADGKEAFVLYLFCVLLIMLSSTILSSSTLRDEPTRDPSWLPAFRVLIFATVCGSIGGLISYIADGRPWGTFVIVLWSSLYLSLNYFGVIIYDTLKTDPDVDTEEDVSKVVSIPLILAPFIIPVSAVLLAVFLGKPAETISAVSDQGFWESEDIALKKQLGLVYSFTIGASVLLFILKVPPLKLSSQNQKPKTGLGRFLGIAAFGVTVFACVITILWPMVWSFFGPLFVGTIFFGALALNTAWLTVISVKHFYGVPIPIVLVALMMIFGKLGVTSNHSVRGVKAHDPVFSSYHDAAEYFLKQQTDDPIYLIAAQGGGLYAGYHVAFDLALRSDKNGNFRTQVFAISGVSGGAVGASVYWAMARCAEEENGDCNSFPVANSESYATAVNDALNRDFLTPVAASLLFPDFASELIPLISRVTGFERGIALSRSIKEGISIATNDQIGEEFAGSIHATAKAGAPLLIINASRLDDGMLMDFSPVENPRHRLQSASDKSDLALADAVVASARFPIITPASRVYFEYVSDEPRGPSQLIDGGFYDNTGLEGLRPALEALIAKNAGRREIRVLLYGVANNKSERRSNFGTLSSPLVGLNSTRSARNNATIRAFFREFKDNIKVQIYDCTITTGDFNLTLSWLLSLTSINELEKAVKDLHFQTSAEVVDEGKDEFCPEYEVR